MTDNPGLGTWKVIVLYLCFYLFTSEYVTYKNSYSLSFDISWVAENERLMCSYNAATCWRFKIQISSLLLVPDIASVPDVARVPAVASVPAVAAVVSRVTTYSMQSDAVARLPMLLLTSSLMFAGSVNKLQTSGQQNCIHILPTENISNLQTYGRLRLRHWQSDLLNTTLSARPISVYNRNT